MIGHEIGQGWMNLGGKPLTEKISTGKNMNNHQDGLIRLPSRPSIQSELSA